MKYANFFLILILFAILFQSCEKDDFPIQNKEDFENYLAEEIEAQKIPALSVLIFKEDKVLYEKTLGKSNIEQDINLEKTHPFLLASISKVVTATALMQLYDDNLFALNDNINDYLDFNVSVPNANTDITFKMLLTHTAAIADGSALDAQYYNNEDSPVSLEYFLENYLVAGGVFYHATENFYTAEPGSTYKYSNTANALIALLVEKISGIDFNTYCKQNIFLPLNMKHTNWRLDEISGTIVQPYQWVAGNYEAILHYTFTDYPNGGLRATSSDLFQFLSAFVQSGKANNFQVLEAQTVKEMTSPQIPNVDSETGLHLFIMNAENKLWGHDGGEKGAATIMAFNLETKIGAIILCNQGDANLDDMLVKAYQLGLELE